MYDQYEGLIFDLDGTLADTIPAHNHSWAAALNHFAIPFTVARMKLLSGVSIPETIKILAEEARMAIDITAVERMKEAVFYEHFAATIAATPLVEQVVRRYFGRKSMAVGTGSSTAVAQEVLKALAIEHYFDCVVGADQVSRCKPWPDIFLAAAAELNVAPSRCIVFEDADSGIAAAHAAGMAVVDVRELVFSP